MDFRHVGKFVPFSAPPLAEYEGSVSLLQHLIGRSPQYTGRGRWALGELVAALGCKKVLLPSYICSTVCAGLRWVGASWDVYDLDQRDLNADPSSIEERLKNGKYDAVLVASMYGNPADLKSIESVCAKYGASLIDDAAQCFGSKLEGRFVGTFGDAGFVAFSPGKPVTAHMGAFYWTTDPKSMQQVSIKRRRWLLHKVIFASYRHSRAQEYLDLRMPFSKFIEKIARYCERLAPSHVDAFLPFEDRLIEQALLSNFAAIAVRRKRVEEFIRQVSSDDFRVIVPLRGESNPHKLILVFPSTELRLGFEADMRSMDVFCQKGYECLKGDSATPIAEDISSRILELPVDEDERRFEYLIEATKNVRRLR